MPIKQSTKQEIFFGFQHVMKATPAFIGKIRMGMNIAIIGIIPYLSDIATEFNISEKRLDLVIAAIGIGLNALSTMFGVPIDGKMVPASDVTELKTGHE